MTKTLIKQLEEERDETAKRIFRLRQMAKEAPVSDESGHTRRADIIREFTEGRVDDEEVPTLAGGSSLAELLGSRARLSK